MKKRISIFVGLLLIACSVGNAAGIITSAAADATTNTVAAGKGVMTTTAVSSNFKDIASHWSKLYVERLYREGYVKGSQGYFNPNQALKTEDFLIMVIRVLDPTAKDLTASDGEAYYKPFVDKALEMGLIKGEYDEVPQYIGRMMPRELAVQVIDRALTIKGEILTADHGLAYKFTDYAIINDVNKDAVLKAYQLGIVKGSKGKFMPKNPLTRAESAVLITKLMDKSARDKLTFVKNPKTYDEEAEWYMAQFDATTTKRTVVVQKNADGSINDGDVNFKEIRKWWTDQEFEDRMIENIHNGTTIDYSNTLTGSGNPSKVDLKGIQGGFYVHNGEINFILRDGIKDQKAYKMYEGTDKFSVDTYNVDYKNLNRVMYDLAKYATQHAYETGTYASAEMYSDYALITLQSTFNKNSAMTHIKLNIDGAYAQKSYKTKFIPRVQITNVYDWEKNKPFIKQAIYRVYGKVKGEQVFQFVNANMAKGNTQSEAYFTKQSSGVWYKLSDPKDTFPMMFTSLEQ